MRPLTLLILAFTPAILRADPIPSLNQDLGPVASFTLIERSGKHFGPDDLRGKVWVAHFFFTGCAGDCSKTTAHMSRLHGLFQGKRDVAFVSITVNPEQDTPELLQRFADGHFATPDQWLFLTGAQDNVHEIIQKSFFQSVAKAKETKPGFEVDHSFSLVLVDRAGTIRGYIDGRDIEAVRQLEDRIRDLAGARYFLPGLNAVLNSCCTILLIAGYMAIRLRKEKLHTALMLAALGVSIVFLACYLYFHFVILGGQPTRFRGDGLIRPVYFTILLTHTVLAALVAPLALYVAYQGLRDHRPRHVRVARWTLPIWLYVSITGVVVYCLLYIVYPPY